MKKHLIHFLLVAVLSICSAAAFAQTTVRGQLVDSETGEPLVGAAVMIEGTSQGTVTDIDGYFKQDVAQGGTLLFKYVGFKDLKKKITQKGASVDLGAIQMEPDAVVLKELLKLFITKKHYKFFAGLSICHKNICYAIRFLLLSVIHQLSITYTGRFFFP